MMGSGMCRKIHAALVASAMVFQTPVAWAQLADVDPALHAAVEALVTSDPEVARDPELAELCRGIAEATIVDPRERSAVTGEVVALQREGVDLSTVIPKEVRDAAREKFTQVQGEMREKLEALQATNPERAREIELMMREGERCMLAFESGERYAPSAEMVAHANEMFSDWKEGMLAQGAPPDFVARAEFEFTTWTGGEHFGMPGHEFTGPGGPMPSVEQMQAMGMTAEQIQMAHTYAGGEFPQGGMMAGPMEGHSMMAPTGGWEAAYTTTGGWETSYTGGTMETFMHEMGGTYGSTEIKTETQINQTEQQQHFQQQQVQERTEFVNHVGHLVDNDNNPATPDMVHSHEIHIHSDSTRHDHTTPGSGL